MGNERTLDNSESVWEDLVHDAKKRKCFFNADENKDMAKAILAVKMEFYQLDRLLDGSSILFQSARWKVHNSVCRPFLSIIYCCYAFIIDNILHFRLYALFYCVAGSLQ